MEEVDDWGRGQIKKWATFLGVSGKKGPRPKKVMDGGSGREQRMIESADGGVQQGGCGVVDQKEKGASLVVGRGQRRKATGERLKAREVGRMSCLGMRLTALEGERTTTNAGIAQRGLAGFDGVIGRGPEV